MILAILLNEIDVASAVSVVTQAHTLDAAWLLCGSMVTVCERGSVNKKWRWWWWWWWWLWFLLILLFSLDFFLLSVTCFADSAFAAVSISPLSLAGTLIFTGDWTVFVRCGGTGGGGEDSERERARCGQNTVAKIARTNYSVCESKHFAMADDSLAVSSYMVDRV